MENEAKAVEAVEAVEAVVAEQVETVSRWVDALIEYAITYGLQIVGALLFLVIGLKVAGWFGARVVKMAEGREVDATLARFFGNIVKLVLVVFVAIITLGNFGVTIAPLIALAGASAFGATLAIQGPLANYGAGISIILSRPFVVGNTITINKVTSGVVEDVKLAATLLRGEDGELITVPNKEIVGRVIVNSEISRVVETKICIDQGADCQKAIEALRKAVDGIADVSSSPSPQVGVHDFTYGGIVLGMRFWVPSSKYFQTRYTANLAALENLRGEGIELLNAGSIALPAASLSADEEQDEQAHIY